MFTRTINSKILLSNIRYPFGKFTNLIKGFLESIVREDQKSLKPRQHQYDTSIPKNQIEAQRKYQTTQKTLSELQKNRLKKIDQVLGTKTYFHETRLYQERLDSSHVMEIRFLAKKYKQTKRSDLDWSNPQAPPKIKIINKKKHYNALKNLRTYPTYSCTEDQLHDQKDPSTIDFLGKQTLYSNLSLKDLNLTIESIEQQYIQFTEQTLQTFKYTYFSPKYSSSMYRISNEKYRQELSTLLVKFIQQQNNCQFIVSLTYLYHTLKKYQYDQRVESYLKKVENNTIQYLVSQIVMDSDQNDIIIVLDLLGTQKQFCLIHNNLYLKQQYSQDVIFNVKPKCVVIKDTLYYIQRSQEGGFIELMAKNLRNKQQNLIYRCQPYFELDVFSNQSFVFVTEKQYKSKFDQKLYLINPKDGKLILIESSNQCRYESYAHDLGIIISKFYSTQSNKLKYGELQQYCTQINLIPFNEDTNLITQFQQTQTELQCKPREKQVDDLKIQQRKLLFKCDQGQYIRQFQVKKSHLVINISKISIYNQNRLYFLPFKQSVPAHSLVILGYEYLLKKQIYKYSLQQILFTLKTSMLSTTYRYSIWKKQLEQIDKSKIHSETIDIKSEENPHLSIRVLCHQNYLQDKNLPVIVFYPQYGYDINETALKKVLAKGIMIIQCFGRGSTNRDALYYLQGSRQNYLNGVKDFEECLKFIGNNFSTNISLYAKGAHTSFLSFLLSIKYPNLLNSVVLHNGVYDTTNIQQCIKLDNSFSPIWQHLNPLNLKFMNSDQKSQDLTIGYLKYIIISSQESNRTHSRKLIHKLRQNKLIKYKDVYLVQHRDKYQTDLYNLSYIYKQIRQRKQQ